MITQHLIHIDFLDEQIAVFDAQIAQHIEMQAPTDLEPPADPGPSKDAVTVTGDRADMSADAPLAGSAIPWQEAVQLLDTIPGIGPRLAEILVAEIGTDMSRFPSAAHLASWAKLAPGQYESAGKRTSGKIGHPLGEGNRWLRSALVQAAHAAVRVKASYFAAAYRRLLRRRGIKKALVAIAHKILTAIYIMLVRREPYRDLGAAYLDSRQTDRLIHRMQWRIEQLGYKVYLEPIKSMAA